MNSELDPELYKKLDALWEELMGANFYANRSRLEITEIHRIRVLNKIIMVANEYGLAQLAYLAEEAKDHGDAIEVLNAIEQMLE